MGIAAKGYVHRLVGHCKGEYSDKEESHINALARFWGNLRRSLAAKAGFVKNVFLCIPQNMCGV